MRLEDQNVIQSMSRKGNCLDNAMAENFFSIMKTELLYAEEFESPEAFMKALEEYIDYYNNKKIKSRLNGKRLNSKSSPNNIYKILPKFTNNNVFLGKFVYAHNYSSELYSYFLNLRVFRS